MLRANLSLETPMKTWCGEDSNKLVNLGWGSRFVWERDEGSSSTHAHTHSKWRRYSFNLFPSGCERGAEAPEMCI